MRILLEGPDNAGKTSLAMRLVEALGDKKVRYFHPGGRPETLQDEINCLNEQYSVLKENQCILDRCTAISQQVYNPDGMDHTRQQAMLSMMAMAPTVIYCRPSTDKLMRVKEFTWRDGESEEHKQKIISNQHMFIERYDAIMSKLPCVAYDYEDEPHREIIFTKLVNAFNGEAADQLWFYNLVHYRD